jgi:hypothetical protein
MADPRSATSRELRKHIRFQLAVPIRLGTTGAAVVLPAINISVGGIYVLADGNDLDDFSIGSQHEITVTAPGERSVAPVRATATVVRQDADGMALMWVEESTKTRILALIEEAGP